jgi:hypothetical protein
MARLPGVFDLNAEIRSVGSKSGSFRGTDDLANLQALCAGCNLSKGAA